MTTAELIQEFGKTGKSPSGYADAVLCRYSTLGVDRADTHAIIHALASLPDEAWGSREAVDKWKERLVQVKGKFEVGERSKQSGMWSRAQLSSDIANLLGIPLDRTGIVEWEWVPGERATAHESTTK